MIIYVLPTPTIPKPLFHSMHKDSLSQPYVAPLAARSSKTWHEVSPLTYPTLHNSHDSIHSLHKPSPAIYKQDEARRRLLQELEIFL